MDTSSMTRRERDTTARLLRELIADYASLVPRYGVAYARMALDDSLAIALRHTPLEHDPMVYAAITRGIEAVGRTGRVTLRRAA